MLDSAASDDQEARGEAMTPGPYIVTHRRTFTRQVVGCHSTSRRAVATLEEAKALARALAEPTELFLNTEVFRDRPDRLMVHLPDGSTVEVEAVTWHRLYDELTYNERTSLDRTSRSALAEHWNTRFGVGS